MGEATPDEVYSGEMLIEKTAVEKDLKGTVYKSKASKVEGKKGSPEYHKVTISIETGDPDLAAHMPRKSILTVDVQATQRILEEADEPKKKGKQKKMGEE